MCMPVSVGQIAHSAIMEEILHDYLDPEQEDIAQALVYTVWLAHEAVHHA